MRYAKIQDILHTRSFKNSNAVKLLYYCTLQRDYQNNTLTTTYSKLSRTMNITISALRHALRQLEKDKLLEIRTTRNFTYITIPNEKLNRDKVSDPRQILALNIDKISSSLECEPRSLDSYIDKFLEQQSLAGKNWIDEKDLVSHFCNWYLKKATTMKTIVAKREVNNMRRCEAEERRKQREAQQAYIKKRQEGSVTYEEYARMKAEGKI